MEPFNTQSVSNSTEIINVNLDLNQNINEEFYMKGMQNAQKIFKGISVAKKVKDETIKKYNNIFYPIKNFDFDTRKLTYK